MGTGGPARGEPGTAGGGTAAGRVAARLAEAGGPARGRLAAAAHQLGEVDRAVYAAIAGVPTPALDVPVRILSRAADKSRLWLVITAGLAAGGGPAGRRAAARGLAAIGITSAVVNLAIKPVYRRRRPDREQAQVPGARQVRMPASASFPSGHSATAFAFATATGTDAPWLSLVLHLLAAGVAYSRVHTGVHYPGDTVIGAVIGAVAGQTVAGVSGQLPPRQRAGGSGP